MRTLIFIFGLLALAYLAHRELWPTEPTPVVEQAEQEPRPTQDHHSGRNWMGNP